MSRKLGENSGDSKSEFGRYRVSSHEWDEIVEVRRSMHLGGWHVVPSNEGGKKPVFANWPSYQYDINDPEPAVPRTKNASGQPTKAKHFGTGAKTKGIIALDIDIEDPVLALSVRRAFEAVAGQADIVRYRENSSRRMMIYRAGKGVREVTWSKGIDGSKLECDANHEGQFVHLHGLHPSGAVLEYEGDAPWDVAVRELATLDMETLQAAYTAGVRALGVDEKAIASVTSMRSREDLGSVIADLLTGASITPAGQEIARAMIFDYNANAMMVEDLLVGLIHQARRFTPTEGKRYDNLLKQITGQTVGLVGAMEKKRDAMAEEEMREDVVRGRMLKMNADNRRRSFLIAVNRLTEEELDSAIDYMMRRKGTTS